MTLDVAHQGLWCCWFLEKSFSTVGAEGRKESMLCYVLLLWKCHVSAPALQDRCCLWDNRPDRGNVGQQGTAVLRLCLQSETLNLSLILLRAV